LDDIYFIKGLDHRGEVVNIKARVVGGGMNIEDYISTHCVAGTDKLGIQHPTRVIENLSLNITMLVFTWISRSALLHQESRPFTFYVVESLRRIFYD